MEKAEEMIVQIKKKKNFFFQEEDGIRDKGM